MDDFYEIDFLDVEAAKSGDAICIRYSLNNKTFIHIVDGGFESTGKKIIDLIEKYYGAECHVDHVVATHNDGDHAVGLRAVLEHFSVGALWMLRPWMYADELIDRFSRYKNVDNLKQCLREVYSNLYELENIALQKNIPIYEPFQGAKIGSFTVMSPSRSRYLDLIVASEKTPDVLANDRSIYDAVVETFAKIIDYIKAEWGEEKFSSEDTSAENNMSIVQYACLCDKKILLTADTGREGLQEVIEYAPNVGLALPGIDTFQVPHHGSRRNVSSDLLDKILGEKVNQGEIIKFYACILAAREDNNHPKKAVVRAMYHRGGNVLTTKNSTISCSFNAANREGWSKAKHMDYPEEQEK